MRTRATSFLSLKSLSSQYSRALVFPAPVEPMKRAWKSMSSALIVSLCHRIIECFRLIMAAKPQGDLEPLEADNAGQLPQKGRVRV